MRVCMSQASMNVGVAHSEVNPNTRVMNSRGIWLTYALGVGILHIVLLSIPFFSVPVVWTLTNVIHNLVSSTSPLCIPVLVSNTAFVCLRVPESVLLQTVHNVDVLHLRLLKKNKQTYWLKLCLQKTDAECFHPVMNIIPNNFNDCVERRVNCN